MGTINTISQLLGLVALVAFIWLLVVAFRKKHIAWGLAILGLPIIPIVVYFIYFRMFGPSTYHLYIPWAIKLVAPIAASVYAVKYWDEAKKPFIAFISAFTVSVALGMYVFTAAGGWKMMKASQEVARGIRMENLTQEDALKFMRSGLDMAETADMTEEEKKDLEATRKLLNAFESGMTEEKMNEIKRDLDLPVDQPEAEKKEEEITLEAKPVHSAVSTQKTPAPTLIRFDGRGAGVTSRNRALAQARKWIGRPVIVERSQGKPQEALLTGISGTTLKFEKRWGAGFFSFSYKAHEIKSLALSE